MSWVGAGEPAAAGVHGGYVHDNTQPIDAIGGAFHTAIYRGDSAYIAHQLAEGAGPAVIEFRRILDRTPLITAAIAGRERCAELLINAGAQLEARNDYGQTALFCASDTNHPGVVSLLLTAGAAVDAFSYNKRTPLMAAADSGCLEVVELLLDAGANRELRDKHGTTALDLATVHTRAAASLNAMYGMDALELAAARNRAAVVAILKKHERIETVVRPEVVACSGVAMPAELAELCGDYVAMTPERRAIQARQERN
jgi:ankyrin repeat protein